MKRLVRTVSVCWGLAPFAIAFMRDRRSFLILGRPARRTHEQHRTRAERLSMRLARFGPAFVKIAQLLSARADILPEPYLSEIAKLQDRVPPDTADAIRHVIETVSYTHLTLPPNREV